MALYVGGTGEVRFKQVEFKDLGRRFLPDEKVSSRFREQRISDFYYAWSAAAADINHDGILDVVAGPFYYLGPDYQDAVVIDVRCRGPGIVEVADALLAKALLELDLLTDFAVYVQRHVAVLAKSSSGPFVRLRSIASDAKINWRQTDLRGFHSSGW